MSLKNYIGYVLVMTVGLLFGILLKIAIPAIWHQPAISIEPEIIDFGEVGTAQVYTGVFTVKNSGHAPLNVSLLKANCTCTVTEMCENPILPGEKSPIKVQMKAPNVEQDFGAEIAIKTNDNHNPEITLGMHGTAVSVLKVNPLNLLFGDVHVKDLPLRKKFVIQTGRLAKQSMLESLQVKCDHPSIISKSSKDTKRGDC